MCCPSAPKTWAVRRCCWRCCCAWAFGRRRPGRGFSMAEPAFSVCVYCGSRPGENPAFALAAQAVGRWIGAHGGQLGYGGGGGGALGGGGGGARAGGGGGVAGAGVVGVIPQALVDKEQANRLCDELHIVHTMHERKAMMAERSAAFVALPGGIGMLEELLGAWTWREFGYQGKPLGLLNVAGYYDGLLGFLQTSVASGFMGAWQMDLLQVATDAQELLCQLMQRAGPGQAPMPLRSVI